MDESEIRRLLQLLFDDRVRPRLSGHTRRQWWKHVLHGDDYLSVDQQLALLNSLIRVNRFQNSDADLTDIVRPKKLSSLLDHLRYRTERCHRAFVESGFAEVIDSHFELIIEFLSIEALPDHDTAALESLGEPDPEATILLYVLEAKYELERKARSLQEVHVSGAFTSAEKALQDQSDKLKNEDNTAEKRERGLRRGTLTGIGKILHGVVIGGVDLVGALSVFGPVATSLGVPPETAGVGAILSGGLAVEKIMEGADKVRFG